MTMIHYEAFLSIAFTAGLMAWFWNCYQSISIDIQFEFCKMLMILIVINALVEFASARLFNRDIYLWIVNSLSTGWKRLVIVVIFYFIAFNLRPRSGQSSSSSSSNHFVLPNWIPSGW